MSSRQAGLDSLCAALAQPRRRPVSRQRLIARGRFTPVALAAGLYMLICLVTRLALSGKVIYQGEAPFGSLPAILGVGALYDAVTCLYLFFPFALYLALVPDRWHRSTLHRLLLCGAFAASLFGLIYLGAVEYYFFDEFNARFNFVAVEYLIYPHEVFVNIWESYPVAQALAAAAVLTVALMVWLRPAIAASLKVPTRFARRVRPPAVMALALIAAQFGVNVTTGRFSENREVNELAQNGIYSFFNAAVNSEMDYPAFYLTLPQQEMTQRLRRLVAQPNARFIEAHPNPIARHVANPGPVKPLHVIVLLEESLGADFVGAYGDTRGLTPNIDRIAGNSLMFTRAYATGTRTVRGMEAVSASFPPVPAEAIVKRPHNEGMFNWSTVMANNGYSPTFIYGGYGTFDNMNHFFGNNGYRVVDRTDMPAPRFGNIWGVSDEDLFENALRVFDQQYARGERIFSIVMTTSNHKPFTFPQGVPGVPAKGGGRDAGVRYADYAIGKFFDALQTRPYYGDAMVIIVGDHGARVYGKEDFPMKSYELPLIIHAPRHFKPQRIDTLTSQIDIAPTVLGLLGISYDSVFFGKDVLLAGAENRFVPMNHNRDVALFSGDRLTELHFRKTGDSFRYDRSTNRQVKAELDREQFKDAQSVFQAAYEMYRRGLYR